MNILHRAKQLSLSDNVSILEQKQRDLELAIERLHAEYKATLDEYGNAIKRLEEKRQRLLKEVEELEQPKKLLS